LTGIFRRGGATKLPLSGKVSRATSARSPIRDEIRFSDALPKTRSGKIIRRLLREIATSGTVAGDVTTLEDFSVLEKLRAEEE